MSEMPSSQSLLNRRNFLKTSALGTGSFLFAPRFITTNNTPPGEDLRFAIISDVHIRYRPEENGCNSNVTKPEDRHTQFIREAEIWNADVIIDLGDMQARTFDEGPGKQVLDAWNSWPREKIAVRGNHDDDFMTADEYVEKMGMPGRYYSKSVKGWTFIVLDSGSSAIAPGSENETWGLDQIPWFEDQLKKAPGRCVVLVHHGRDRNFEPDLPPRRLKAIIDKTNEDAGYQKVVAYLWGHLHRTWANRDKGVHYVLVNSSTYRWGGSGVGPIFYSDPPPYAMGLLSADGSFRLHGNGLPGNWAKQDCEVVDRNDRANDDMTYQISIPAE